MAKSEVLTPLRVAFDAALALALGLPDLGFPPGEYRVSRIFN